MRFLIAPTSRTTGRALERLVKERGATKGEVCYGVRSADGDALNARAGGSKLLQLQMLQRANVPVPPLRLAAPSEEDFGLWPVWYARRAQHHGGTDIAVACQADEAAWRLQAGWAYFTARIPIMREVRVWATAGRLGVHHLGTFSKDMANPAAFRRTGRNNKNGFAFNVIPKADIPRDAVSITQRALEALGLDFGATDMVEDYDGAWRVLEVNTAPGSAPSHDGRARQCVRLLADHITNWSKTL